LRDGATLAIGRDTDVVLDRNDGTLSRRHVAVTAKGGVLSIRDLKSVNGTFLKVDAGRALEDGDEIRIGGQLLRFSLALESRPAMAVDFAPQPSTAVPIAVPQATQDDADAPAVLFQNLDKRCPLTKGRSICDIAEAQGVRVKAQCHEGKCGSDPIRILSGQEHLNKITEIEASTLDMLGFEAGEYRLACVTRATGSIVVEVLDPG
jgi:ferredoxin